jgi:hypothetical protein
VSPAWRTSSFCSFGNCVGVRFGADGWVYVTDTERPEFRIAFTEQEWRDFVAGVRAGEFDA